MKALLTIFTFTPIAAFAAESPGNLKELVELVVRIIGQLTLLVFALTVVVMVWGIAKGWIINGESSEGVKEGSDYLVVGIIALTVMLSIWGIVSLLRSSIF